MKMGSETKKLEIISFEDLRRSNNVDPEAFNNYLEEIFKELSDSKKKGINMTRFSNFLIHCPVFVANKFFLSLLKKGQEDEILTYEQFSTPIVTLKYGTYEEIVKIIFNIFDFDKDGKISAEDMKLVIAYLPLKDEKSDSQYYYQMQSLQELDDIIKETFSKMNGITLKEFLQYLDVKANIFLLLFCYLYLVIPVFEKKIFLNRKKSVLRQNSSDSHNSNNSNSSQSKKTISTKQLYMSPSLFSPVIELRNKIKGKSNLLTEFGKKNKEADSQKKTVNTEKQEVPETPITQSIKLNGTMRIKPDEAYLKNKMLAKEAISRPQKIINSSFLKKERVNKDFKKDSDDLPNSQKITTIIEEPSDELHNLQKTTTIIETTEKAIEEEGYEDKLKLELEKLEIENVFKFEGELLKVIKKDGKQTLKKFYLALMDTSIYYYKTMKDPKESYKKTHYLPGCFIRENKCEEVEGVQLYSFSLIFPQMIKQYYHKESEVIRKWIHKLRESIGYKNFFDYYKMGESIGEGQFGKIKAGIDLQKEEKVAIKILDKKNIKNAEEWDLIRTEIDVLKHSKHPSIIKFKDHYENSDYIFIVMELLKAGTLQDWLEKQEFDVSEKVAAIIAYQIADALQYLHKYGIIHRDLKPENILLYNGVVKNDILELRIMDFGMSKIMGNREKTAEGYGTMAFVAPEIINRSPYDNSIDIWSLGVIVHYMLSGDIPFMPENCDMEEMAENICKKELVLSNKLTGCSPEVKDLIKKCMIKKTSNRIKIEELVKHPWFLKNCQNI